MDSPETGFSNFDEWVPPAELRRYRHMLRGMGIEDPDGFIGDKYSEFLSLDEKGARDNPTFGRYLDIAIAQRQEMEA